MDIPPKRDQNRIWESFSRAVGTEPREGRTIIGASGLEHLVQSISVDDKHGRMVVVASEPNPRTAALMQVDIQATMPDVNVLVARPVVFDLGVIARQFAKSLGGAEIPLDQLKAYTAKVEKVKGRKNKKVDKNLEKLLGPAMRVLTNVTFPGLTQFVDVIQQATYLDWSQVLSAHAENPENPSFSFAKLTEIDNLAIDRRHGVCPIPLYEFSEQDWELFAQGSRIEDVEQRLRKLGVYEYFFPAPDELALGMVERGVKNSRAVAEIIDRAPRLGHPLGSNTLIRDVSELPDILGQLADAGYVAEGEHSVETTPKGEKIRQTVKFRPKEGVFQRLLNRITIKASVSASAKDFLPPG